MVNSNQPTRREQNRVRRRQEYLDVASQMVIRDGIEGLTMQAIADEVGAAVGTIYTYFSSKSALVAELQSLAINLLGQVYDTAAERWEPALTGLDPQVRTLASLGALGDLVPAAAQVYPEEFLLEQRLIAEPTVVLSDEDAARLFPMAMQLAERPLVLIDRAVTEGALAPGATAMARSISWVAAINGILLLDSLQRFDVPELDLGQLCHRITFDLLRGWGADPHQLGQAEQVVAALTAKPDFVPALPRWTDTSDPMAFVATTTAVAEAPATSESSIPV